MAENPSSNFNLNRPPTGSEDGTDNVNWGEEINDNFSTLDSELLIRDTKDNQDQYTPYVDVLYYATDTEQFFIADGTTFNPISTIGEDTHIDILESGAAFESDIAGINVSTELDNFTLTRDQPSQGFVTLGTGDHSGEDLGASSKIESISTLHSHTEERGPDVIVWVDDSFHVWASGPEGIISDGFSPGVHLQAAIDYVAANGWGDVILKDRLVIESATINLKDGVYLTCDRGGALANGLTTAATPVLHVEPGGRIGRLKVDCQGNSGVSIGSANVQQNTVIDWIYMYDCGSGTGEIGVDIAGYQTVWNWIHVQGRDRNCLGVNMVDASDIMGNSTICVGTEDAVNIGNCEHIYMPAIDCDSGDGTALTINSLHDGHVGTTVWCNSSADPAIDWDVAIDIGNDTSLGSDTRGMHLDAVIMRSGPTGLKLAECMSSQINAIITNRKAYPAAPDLMDTAVVYGANVANDVVLNASISRDMEVADISGTPQGVLNGTGYEAATAGGIPTAGNWTEHMQVENTDDNTVWMKARNGSMVQLG